jgi:hypothetical protein
MFSLIIIILFSNNISALGVAPARKIVDFDPGFEGEGELKIVNSEAKNMKVLIYAKGDLGDNLYLEVGELEFLPNEEYKMVKYSFKLPDKYDEPGKHQTNIIIREVASSSNSESSILGASIAVVHNLIIDVPYPGKYATVDLNVLGGIDENRVEFVASVSSFGDEKIINAKAIIDIYNPKLEKIKTIETNLASVDPGKKVGLRGIWEEEVIHNGRYFANVTLLYDGKVAYTERVFEVGEARVEIIDISVKKFRLGEIAKFDIVVDNKWSEKIEDVYTELVFNKEIIEVGRFKSASEDIPALSKGELVAYWDTAGVEEGAYDIKSMLYYNDEKVEKNMKTIINLNSIKFDLFGTGAVIGDTEGLDKGDVAVVAVVVLILLNVGWFIYFKKFKK